MYLSKIVVSLSSSVFFIGSCYWMSKNEIINSFFKRSILTEMGRYTLGIYILQSIVLETIMAEYIKVDTWGGLFSNLQFDIYVLFPFVSFFILWFCASITKLIQKHKMMSFFLLGGIKMTIYLFGIIQCQLSYL